MAKKEKQTKKEIEKNQAIDNTKRNPKKPLGFRFIKRMVGCFYRKRKVVGEDNILSEPAIYIGNHSQMHGPLYAELYFPKPRVTWCAGDIMDNKTAQGYILDDFWPNKNPKKIKRYKRLSKMISPLAAYIFTNADTIAVHHDQRGIATFKNSVEALTHNKNIIIFPEGREEFNHIVNEFQDKFVDLARFYYKKSGKAINFVPMYIAPKLKAVCFGESVAFNPNAEPGEERNRICEYLKDKITQMALELPVHKVVPYANIPKKYYKSNK